METIFSASISSSNKRAHYCILGCRSFVLNKEEQQQYKLVMGAPFIHSMGVACHATFT